MLLDSGAAASGLSEDSVRALGLATKGKGQLAGNGETRQTITFVRNLTFRMGEAEFTGDPVAVIPAGDLESHEGRRIGGILGVDLFRRYVVKVDYAARKIILYDPGSFQYQGDGYAVPLHFKGGAALFAASIVTAGHNRVPAEIAIDSGTYSALRLYGPFASRHHLPVAGTKTVSSFGFGLGGEYAEVMGRVEALDIGPLSLQRPETSFSTAKGGATASGAYDGTIGGAILRRFQVTFDYPHQRLILAPDDDFADPFEVDTAGLILVAGGTDLRTISVGHVLAETPAEAAGVQPGDMLTRINDQDAGDLGLERIRLLFRQPGSYALQLRRGGSLVTVTMVTRRGIY